MARGVGHTPSVLGPGGTNTHVAGRRYRTKVEILRDLLAAAVREFRKTRIIVRANLNEESFSKYSGLALEHGLLGRTPVGYRATPRGREWVQAADRVATKRSELSTAIRDLDGLTNPGLRRHTMDSSFLGPASPSGAILADRPRLGLGDIGPELAGDRRPEGHLGPRPSPFGALALEDDEWRTIAPREPLHEGQGRSPRTVEGSPADDPHEDPSKRRPRLWLSIPAFPIVGWLAALGSALGSLLFGLPFDGGVPG